MIYQTHQLRCLAFLANRLPLLHSKLLPTASLGMTLAGPTQLCVCQVSPAFPMRQYN